MSTTKQRSMSPLRYGRPPSQQHLGSAIKSSAAAAKPSFKSQSPSSNTPSFKLRGGAAPVSPSLSGGSSDNTTLSEKADPSAKSKENVTVTVRFRPLSAREIQKGDEIAWYADGNDTVRSESNASTAYVFDKVFGPATTTRGVYDIAAQHVVNGAMEGINGTVFAYGVTSSGKTHTMHGDQKSPGIIPLAVKDVFNIIQETPNREFLLRVSYLEIYNEVINDLLDPAGQNLRVREDAHGTYVEGIKEEVVLSPAHALSLIAAGEEHRHVGSNNVNLMSSRSHTIFTMTIESSARGEGSCDEEVTLSQLNLIDLAGSESSKAETTGLRRKEGSYINKSLLTLGTVISKLTDGKSSHVPYRDSKLTRLLQSSLGGHGRVSLICTVTPASSSNEETHNTIKFAHRTKHVELQSSANKILDEKSLIKKYQKEISSLKQELERLKKGLVGKPLSDPAHNDLIQLRQQLEAGQVRLQSRLEEEEQAKAALMGRIQRLTKLILVSSKNTVPNFNERPAHRRRYSFGEEELAYLPDKRRALTLEDEEDIEIDLPELSDGKPESVSPDNMTKEEKKSKRRGVLAWFKVKKQPEQQNGDADTGLFSSSEENKASKRKPPRRKLDESPQVDPVPEPTQAGELFSAAGHSRRPPPSGTTMADQMDLLREQVKMLAGEVAFSTSSLKRLGEQAARTPNDTEIQAQLQKLKGEIQSKNQQMKLLEQRIVGGFRSAPSASASAELSQKIVKLTTQLSENTFELEIKTADNRILQEQLQSKEAENLELQNTINSLKQQLEKSGKGQELFHTIETSDWLEAAEEFPSVDAESSRYLAATKADQPAVLRSQANEVERLKQEKTRLLAERKDQEVQKQKLVEEASYAKELATAAAVELKSLAEEVTKLSAQNTRLTNELLTSRSLGAQPGAKHAAAQELEPVRQELVAMRRKMASLEQSLAEKEQIEVALNKKLEEAKQRETDLENDLAGMWVLVAKVKREKDLKPNEPAMKDDQTSLIEQLQRQLEEEKDRRVGIEQTLSQLKSEALEDLDLSTLEGLQNLHVEALTKLCQAKAKAHERVDRELEREKERQRKRSLDERSESRLQADSIASIGVQHLLLEEERNGHVCKVCFEAPTAAVLLPCRHFCLCKSCAIACTECPLCRSGITDRIITFT